MNRTAVLVDARRRSPLLAACGILFLSSCSSQPPRRSPPNILIISLDDMNDWIGPMGGHPQARTPHLDAFAENALTFRRAYTPSPSCNPSRTAMFSGKAPWVTGLYNNPQTWRHVVGDELMMPEYFRKAGYWVAGAGKIYHGNMPDPRGWDDYFPSPIKHMPDYWLPVRDEKTGETRFALTDNEIREDSPKDVTFTMPPFKGMYVAFDFKPLPVSTEQTGDFSSVRWISEQLRRKHDKPFFLAAGIYRPHLPWYVPQEYFDKFPIEQVQLPAVLESDLDDVPEEGQRVARNRYHEHVVEAGLWREAVQGYLAAISYSDALVGKLLADLDASPYADNTIVVIFSDHGWQLGEKKHWRKFSLWEDVLNTVLMVRVPRGVPGLPAGNHPGGISNRNVSLMDVFPMLTELAGIDPKPGVSGRSIVPLLRDPATRWDHPVVSVYGDRHYSVIQGDWHYIRYAAGGEELYSLADDPHEWQNLAGVPGHADRMAEMESFIPEERAPLVRTRSIRWEHVLDGTGDLYNRGR
jgi:arylsulfatase A-like enzyme